MIRSPEEGVAERLEAKALLLFIAFLIRM